MYEEFDRAHRPPLMPAAERRVAELRGDTDEALAPRRPGPIAGRTTAPRWLVPGLVLGAAAALYLLFSSLAPAAPAETYPTALPGASVPTAPWFAPGAEPTAAPAPTSEPLPTAAPAGIGTGEGFIEPIPQQAAPANVGGQAPPVAAPVVVTDLIPEPTARRVFNCPQPTAELDALHCRVQP